jgi:TRAP-type mannitol/chloroaromatic compound transport system substrate-binding protein
MAVSPVSAARPTALAGGVGAGPIWHWRWQSGVTASNSSYWLSEEFSNTIVTASGGRMYIDLLPTGSLCTSYETLDATMTGSVELANS